MIADDEKELPLIEEHCLNFVNSLVNNRQSEDGVIASASTGEPFITFMVVGLLKDWVDVESTWKNSVFHYCEFAKRNNKSWDQEVELKVYWRKRPHCDLWTKLLDGPKFFKIRARFIYSGQEPIDFNTGLPKTNKTE